MVDVRKLLEYNQQIRHKYFETLATLSWDELTRNREASFYSLRNIFVHILGAMDHWLDFLLNEKQLRRKFDEYTSMREIQDYMGKVEARMERYLASLTPEKLTATYTVTNDAGEDIEVSTEDVLIHVFEEEVHHRGEVIALLWQMNIEPPLMGWKYL